MTYVADITTQKAEHARWVRDSGDTTHRVNYNLNKSSIVFDLGGYLGDWATVIYNRYGSKMYIFEPIPDYEKQIREAFQDIHSVKIIGAAASNVSSTSSINLSGDSSSMFEKGNIDIRTVDIVEFIRSENISNIDLMKINIEGAEYDVMEHLIENGLHSIIKNFQIQYHLNVKSYNTRLDWITTELQKTHICSYSYRYIWEGWGLR
jgi:FkbM family methyltransferase